MEHKGHGDANCNCCPRYKPQRIGKATGKLRNKSTSGNHPNYCIIKIGQNTEKNPGDYRKLAVTQIPVKNHWLPLVEKKNS